MSAVLLRLPRLNAIGSDAELEPPDSKARESAEARRREGRAIVGADGVRQTFLSKNALELLLNEFERRSLHDSAAQDEAAMSVGNRQRVAALPIACPKPAFEIGAPRGVRLVVK